MIDLTKPVRSKLLGIPTQVHEVSFYCISGGGASRILNEQEFERDYENIPEPRKPREWHITIDSGGNWAVLSNLSIGTRVIEWPEGAPLPDWPEGY